MEEDANKAVKLVWERELTFNVPPEQLQETIDAIKNQPPPVAASPTTPSSTSTPSEAPSPSYLPVQYPPQQHPRLTAPAPAYQPQIYQPAAAALPIYVPIQAPQDIEPVELHHSPHHRGGLKPEHRFDFTHGGGGGEGSVEHVTTPGRQNELAVPLLAHEERRSVDEERLPEFEGGGGGEMLDRGDNVFTSISLLTSTMVGVGLFAVPKLFALLGIAGGSIALVIVGLLFYLSFGVLNRSAAATGQSTFSGIMKVTLGSPAAVVLDIAQVVYTFGALVLVLLVLSDIIVGDNGSGLLEGWEKDRSIVLAVLALIILAPVSSFSEFRAFGSSSVLGVIAALLWAAITLVLVISALAHGNIERMRLFPSYEKGWFTSTIQMLATTTILFVAASAHTSLHQVTSKVRPHTPATVSRVGISSLIFGFGLYLVIGLGCYALFGSSVQEDVLKSFTVKAMEPLLGNTTAKATFFGVRLALIVSLVASFPLLMSSFRDALWRQLFWQDLRGPGVGIVTYALVAVVFMVAVKLHSIWKPLVFVGGVGGTLVALIFPGLIALRRQAEEGVVVGGLLLLIGLVLFLCAVGALTFMEV